MHYIWQYSRANIPLAICEKLTEQLQKHKVEAKWILLTVAKYNK